MHKSTGTVIILGKVLRVVGHSGPDQGGWNADGFVWDSGFDSNHGGGTILVVLQRLLRWIRRRMFPFQGDCHRFIHGDDSMTETIWIEIKGCCMIMPISRRSRRSVGRLARRRPSTTTTFSSSSTTRRQPTEFRPPLLMKSFQEYPSSCSFRSEGSICLSQLTVAFFQCRSSCTYGDTPKELCWSNR